MTTFAMTMEPVPIDQLRPGPGLVQGVFSPASLGASPPVGRPHGQCRSQTSAPSLRVRTAEFRHFSCSVRPAR